LFGKTAKNRGKTGKPGKVTNGGILSYFSGFFIIIGGFMLLLTKLFLKAVIVLFYVKSSIFKFIYALLSMRLVSTHESLKVSPFGTVTL
jgi:hypothetical protein